jgi:hypothetical protein
MYVALSQTGSEAITVVPGAGPRGHSHEHPSIVHARGRGAQAFRDDFTARGHDSAAGGPGHRCGRNHFVGFGGSDGIPCWRVGAFDFCRVYALSNGPVEPMRVHHGRQVGQMIMVLPSSPARLFRAKLTSPVVTGYPRWLQMEPGRQGQTLRARPICRLCAGETARDATEHVRMKNGHPKQRTAIDLCAALA